MRMIDALFETDMPPPAPVRAAGGTPPVRV
jgi:hypothetical protein